MPKQHAATQTGLTLLGILRRPNPAIHDRWGGASYTNTVSGTDSFDHVQLDANRPNTVQPWKDFTIEAIQLAYGDLLAQDISDFCGQIPDLSTYQQVDDPPLTPTIIHDEGDIDTLGIVWMCPVVRGPLKAAAHVLRARAGMTNNPTTSATIAAKKVDWKVSAKSNSRMKPDWVIIDHKVRKIYLEGQSKGRQQPPKPLTYVVGDSKLSQKWKSNWLALPPDTKAFVEMDPLGSDASETVRRRTVNQERLKPLMQLAAYCRYAETRYAYIITQTEVVAFRIRRIPPLGHLGHTAAIEYASAPWSAQGKDGLTGNLAIWALGCMAMNDGHRAMEGPQHTPLAAMAKLTWWQYNEEHRVYENVISKRRIAAKDWRPEYNKFVQLDGKDGQSFTSTFVASGSVPKIPQSAIPGKGGVEALAKSMQGMKLGPASGGSSSSTAGPSTTAAKSAASFKTCVIGNNTYTLHMKGDKYFVYLDEKKKQAAWIQRDDKSNYTAEIGGKIRAVKMVP